MLHKKTLLINKALVINPLALNQRSILSFSLVLSILAPTIPALNFHQIAKTVTLFLTQTSKVVERLENRDFYYARVRNSFRLQRKDVLQSCFGFVVSPKWTNDYGSDTNAYEGSWTEYCRSFFSLWTATDPFGRWRWNENKGGGDDLIRKGTI